MTFLLDISWLLLASGLCLALAVSPSKMFIEGYLSPSSLTLLALPAYIFALLQYKFVCRATGITPARRVTRFLAFDAALLLPVGILAAFTLRIPEVSQISFETWNLIFFIKKQLLTLLIAACFYSLFILYNYPRPKLITPIQATALTAAFLTDFVLSLRAPWLIPISSSILLLLFLGVTIVAVYLTRTKSARLLT